MAISRFSKQTILNGFPKLTTFWDQTSVLTVTVDYLVIAGGGGGGSYGANANGDNGAYTSGSQGSNSSISGTGITTITSTGGGFGGAYNGIQGGTGGCGGGSGGPGAASTISGGAGTTAQGFDGGLCWPKIFGTCSLLWHRCLHCGHLLKGRHQLLASPARWRFVVLLYRLDCGLPCPARSNHLPRLCHLGL